MIKKIVLFIFILLFSFVHLGIDAELSSPNNEEIPWEEPGGENEGGVWEVAQQDAEKEVRESLRSKCFDTLTIAYDLELASFFRFLEGHFLNESSNSSLTNIAISRYLEYTTRVNTLFFLAIDQKAGAAITGDQGIIEETSPLLACSALRGEYIQIAKDKMVEHIKNNQARKRSMIIVEKYKAINSGLRDMNMEVAKIYGAFMTFYDKLPWFSKNCVQN